ncbi:unnamed protein product [Urochloa humidicola]
MGRRRVFGPTRGTAGQPGQLHDRSRSGALWSTDGLLYFGTGVFDLGSGDRKCCSLVCLRWPAVDATSLARLADFALLRLLARSRWDAISPSSHTYRSWALRLDEHARMRHPNCGSRYPVEVRLWRFSILHKVCD